MTPFTSISAFQIVSDLISEGITDEKRAELFKELVSRPITSDLLTEGVQALQTQMVPTQLDAQDAVDTCGTGGSGKQTINTSTLTSFIVAAAGGKVAKHGNRSASGNCGCFDLLELLGIRINLTPDEEAKIFSTLGIVFLFAPLHHPSLRHVAALRKQYGKKTIFNLIGPLCNPSGVRRQLIGSGSDEHADIITHTLRNLGTDTSMVVTGHDGLDEVTLTSKTTVRTVSLNEISVHIFDPIDVGMELVQEKDIQGGNAETNSQLFLNIAQGRGPEAMRNLVILNAAHALLLTSVASSIEQGLDIARSVLQSGEVYELFLRYKTITS